MGDSMRKHGGLMVFLWISMEIEWKLNGGYHGMYLLGIKLASWDHPLQKEILIGKYGEFFLCL